MLITGPDSLGISGEPTHLRTLFSSPLAAHFTLLYHRVGGGERRLVPENPLKRYFFRLTSLVLFWRKLSRKKPQIVHINNSFNLKGLARDCSLALLAKLRGARVVFEMHGGHPESWVRAHPLCGRLFTWALRRVDAFAVLSGEQAEFVRRRLGKEPFAVPNMIQVRAEEPAKPAEPPYFLYLGRLLKTKGVYELLEAAKKVKAKVILVGDGPERERLREMAGENVELVGFAVGRRKEELLRGAYALVLPSYHEGMPYALLEGMAWGVPAVATEVGGVPQLVRNGVEGLLVPPGDAEALAEAMNELLEKENLRYNLAKGALRRAREFSVERLWVEYARVYESLLG